MSETLPSLFDRGAVDLALGAAIEAPTRLIVEPFYEEEMVRIAACENPIAGVSIDAAQIVAHPRVLIAAGQPFEATGQPAGDRVFPPEQADWGLRQRRGIV